MPRQAEVERIAACRRGDRVAISELFEQHYPSSLRIARRILRSEQEALDAVQSAYLAALRHLQNFRGDAAFKTWISRIVTNQCLMVIRQSKSHYHYTSLDSAAEPVSPFSNPEESAFRQEIASALAMAAARLPKRLYEAFRLYSFSGFTIQEVAAATGLTVPAAKTRIFRANLRMREHLQPVWHNYAGAEVRRKAA